MKQKSPRALCVEDNKALCDALRAVMALGDQPVEMDFAHDGESAMDLLVADSTKEHRYRLVIFDVRLPRDRDEAVDEILGLKMLYDLLEQQNSLSLLKEGTPIIVHTAWPSYDDCVKCMRMGAADYIPKTGADKNNAKVLAKRCRELAYPEPAAKSPESVWLDEHLDNVMEEYGGGFVGLIGQESGNGLPVIGDFAVLRGENFDDVRRKIVANRVWRWQKPFILSIPTPDEMSRAR